MRRRTALATAGLALLSLALSGCSLNGAAGTATPESLVGTWSLAERFDAPEQPFLSFARDKTWSGSDGCNHVRGEWELDADGSVAVTSGPQTRLACDGAPLPDAILNAERVEIRGDTLVILGSNVGPVTELARSRDPLVGPARLPVGYWTADDSKEAPFLHLSSKGSFTGFDGCNTLTGPWELTDDGAISFRATVSTEKYCDSVDAWLGEAVLGRAVSGVMTLHAADGTVPGQLAARQ